MFKISNVFKSVVYCYYLFWWFFFLQNKLHAISFAGKSVFAVDASSGSLLYSRKFLSEQPISIAVYDAESRRSVNSKYFSWINTYDLMRWMSAGQQTFATKPYPHLFFSSYNFMKNTGPQREIFTRMRLSLTSQKFLTRAFMLWFAIVVITVIYRYQVYIYNVYSYCIWIFISNNRIYVVSL